MFNKTIGAIVILILILSGCDYHEQSQSQVASFNIEGIYPCLEGGADVDVEGFVEKCFAYWLPVEKGKIYLHTTYQDGRPYQTYKTIFTVRDKGMYCGSHPYFIIKSKYSFTLTEVRIESCFNRMTCNYLGCSSMGWTCDGDRTGIDGQYRAKKSEGSYLLSIVF